MFHKYMFQKPKMFQMKISKDSKFKSDWVEQAKIASWYIKDCAGKSVKISHLVGPGTGIFLTSSIFGFDERYNDFKCESYKSSLAIKAVWCTVMCLI